MTELSKLYDIDYAAWARCTADLLRARHYEALDIVHLLEELDDMGKSEQRELENRLTILIAHLLEWQYQLPRLSERWREFDGKGDEPPVVGPTDGA
jgi:hypothetical protein